MLLVFTMCTKNQFDAKELIGRGLKNKAACRLVKLCHSCCSLKSILSYILKILDDILLVYNVAEPINNVL